MSNTHTWSAGLRKFEKDEGGSVLMLFGLVVIVLFMFAGCGLDFARAQHASSKARAALDAATLAAAKAMREDSSLTDSQLLTLAQDYFTANIVRAGVGGTTWTPVTFSPPPNRVTGTIKASVTGDVSTYFYRVATTAATGTAVVINEFMASNTNVLADPQGQFDDWIELRNLTTNDVDLTGRYLSDEPGNLRKWAFPTGTVISAEGFLLVWADEDTTDTPGLHTSFKLSAGGEEFFLVDADTNLNAVLDSISYPAQTENLSYGRASTNEDAWVIMAPTPLGTNL